MVVVGGEAPHGKDTMPNTTDTIAEQVAEALAEGRTLAGHTVAQQAERRESTGYAPVALVQVLDPRAGQEGRAAHLLDLAERAGVLAEDFRPVTVRDFTTGEPIDVLTPGQVKVLRCAAQGLSYTQTAATLNLSVSTVKGHVGAYYKRLGVHSVPEAIIAAVRCGVLPVSFLTGEEAPTPEPFTEEEMPQVDRTPVRVRCSAEGCRKRTSHLSGTCRDHREA